MKSKLVGFVILWGVHSSAANLNMESYLESVFENNPAYKAAVENTHGAKLRNGEADLLVLPILTLEASNTVDEKDTFTPTATGTKNDYTNYLISLEQYTPIGLHAKIKYEQLHRDTTVPGGVSTVIPVPDYYSGTPSLELTQSLWRNGFGREIRAKREAIDTASMATYYAERYKISGIRWESQVAYIKLYYSQKILNSIKESMDVSVRLRDWTKKRVEQELGERSDYLQAKSAYEFRQLDYLQAQQDVKSAARAFNSLRGLDSDSVDEELLEPALAEPLLKPFHSFISRDDVRAAKKQLEFAKAQSLEGVERGMPTLDIYATYGWYGLDAKESQARSEAFKDTYPYYTVGIQFKSPLMFGILNDMKDGYEKEVQAAKFNLERKNQELQRDYKDLVDRLGMLSQKFKLAMILEQSQKEKVSLERLKQKRGRTTLFQVLQFEQDYVDAQLNRYKTEVELKTQTAQFQLYKEE